MIDPTVCSVCNTSHWSKACPRCTPSKYVKEIMTLDATNPEVGSCYGSITMGIGGCADEPYAFVIGMNGDPQAVKIRMLTGEVLFGPGYEPTEAARLFWEGIASWSPILQKGEQK